MQASLGAVLRLRNTMVHLIDAQDVVDRAKEGVFQGLPEDLKNWANWASGSRLGFQYFSDSLICYSPLPESSRAAMSFCLFSTLLGVKILMLRSFADRCPLRGGIEIGYGIEWEPHQFYGPVLRDAYRLESKIADYPRVLIGKQVLTFLQSAANQAETTLAALFERHWATRALSFLWPDSDGWHTIDFLGFHPSTLAMPDFPALVGSSLAFIRSEAERVQDDKKLHARYQRLMRYCESCEEDWRRSGKMR